MPGVILLCFPCPYDETRCSFPLKNKKDNYLHTYTENTTNAFVCWHCYLLHIVRKNLLEARRVQKHWSYCFLSLSLYVFQEGQCTEDSIATQQQGYTLTIAAQFIARNFGVRCKQGWIRDNANSPRRINWYMSWCHTQIVGAGSELIAILFTFIQTWSKSMIISCPRNPSNSLHYFYLVLRRSKNNVD